MGDLTNERTSFEQALLDLLNQYESGSGGGTIAAARLTIINYVKAKLDELVPEGEGVLYNLETEPNISNPYDLLINAHLDEAAKNVLMTAPLHCLTPKKDTTSSGTADSGGAKTGYIALPADFLRLYSLKMTEWERPVTEAISITDPLYKLQKNAYVRGGVSKPVAALAARIISTTPTNVIEYYSVSSAHTIEWFLYIGEVDAEYVQENLHDALAWICAGKIRQIIGDYDGAKTANEQAQLCYKNM